MKTALVEGFPLSKVTDESSVSLVTLSLLTVKASATVPEIEEEAAVRLVTSNESVQIFLHLFAVEPTS